MLKTKFLPKGFTLVEVLVALGVISITMGLFGYFVKSLSLSTESKHETSAASFAHRYINTLRSNWQSNFDYDAGVLPNLSPPSGYDDYKLTIVLLDNAGNTTSTYTEDYSNGFSSLNSSADNMRQINLLLTMQQGGLYQFSTQIVRPPQ